jgi:hypothetical protein
LALRFEERSLRHALLQFSAMWKQITHFLGQGWIFNC